MATVPALALIRRLRTLLGGLAVLATLTTGCVTITPPSLSFSSYHTPAPKVSQVVMAWQNWIGSGPDPANGGRPIPILTGRMYLFGPRLDYPMLAQGGCRVEVFDESSGVVAPTPAFTWDIDAKDMPTLMKKDFIGIGYTMLLPWPSYHPSMHKLRVRTAYFPPDSLPIYSENVVTLDVGNGQMQDARGYIQPATFQNPKHVEIPKK
ncbi:MAG: hypothetical protein SNJ75_09260 [Gemmataceae bacterium]